MANYPPPPPGGQAPPPPPGGNYPPGGGPPGWGPGGQDPYAQERALAAWAEERKYVLNPQPQLAYYLSWFPCQFVSRPTSVTREVRATFGEAQLFVAEVYEPVALGIEQARRLLFLLTSPSLRYRVALRSRDGGGLTAEVDRGFKEIASLFGGGGQKQPPGAILGDPTLESRFEVMAPSREEGNAALPVPLRQLLVQPQFRGILELRPQGMACQLFDYVFFEPRTLDAAIAMIGALYQAATLSP